MFLSFPIIFAGNVGLSSHFSNMETFTAIRPEAIQKVAAHLPYFSSEAQEYYTFNGATVLDAYSYDEGVLSFVEDLYAANFIQAYEWKDWEPQAQTYVDDPGKLAQADLSEFIRLLTFHVRKDRFQSGHLAKVIDNGHIAAVLRALQNKN